MPNKKRTINEGYQPIESKPKEATKVQSNNKRKGIGQTGRVRIADSKKIIISTRIARVL